MRHDIIERLKAEQSLSRPQVYRCLKAGMPIELAAAKEWRARSVRARAKAEESADEAPVDFSGEGLEGTVERLREMERALAEAGARAFKEGKVAEATILRREHVAVIKAIYDAESKLIKIDEARGRLISVDRALSMINEAMQSAILVLRRLPEMGRTPEERARLEAFMNGVLAEIKAGAAAGLKYADRSLVLRNVLSGNGLGCKRAESHDKSHNT